MATDLYHDLDAVKAISPTDGKNDLTGDVVDLKGFDGALIVVYSGTITDGTFTFELQECDTSNGTFTAVADEDLHGSEPVFAAADDDKVKFFGYKGKKRYIKLVATVSGSPTTGGTLGAVIVRGAPLHYPLNV